MALAPLSRIVILTEDGSTIRPKDMVTIPPRNVPPPAVLISYTLSVDGPPSPIDPAPEQDFALEDLGLQPNEGGVATAVQDFALEDLGLQPNEGGGSTPVQDFALEALPTQPSEA